MISASSKYAICTLLEVSRVPQDQFVSVAQLAKRTRIPRPYLAKMIKQLVKAGLLIGRKGPGGGIKLSGKGLTASLYDVCIASNEPTLLSGCLLSKRSCDPLSPCPFHPKWSLIKESFTSFLKTAKISEFAHR